MRRYYFALSGTTVTARYIFDTPTAPSGLTEVTEAQFKAAFDVTRVYNLSGGALTAPSDRDYVFDGDTVSPAGGGRVAFIEP